MADEFCLKMPDFHITFSDLLHVVNLRHGTNGFTSLPKEGALRIFFALKNSTASAGFEPANLYTKGQHATSRPPKPLFPQRYKSSAIIFKTKRLTSSCVGVRICSTLQLLSQTPCVPVNSLRYPQRYACFFIVSYFDQN